MSGHNDTGLKLREIARLLQEMIDSGIPTTTTLATSDIEIGAVELKNGTDDTRATINASNELLVKDTTSNTSLAIIDDWDESDRAKVNPIVGQAGVQGGSGTVSANTQRVTLATDVALPSGENHIGAVGGNTFTLAVTQTTNASAYEAGDAVGGKITITNAMRVSGGTGVLNTIQLIDKGNQKAAMELLIFDSDPAAATITDDTAFVYSTDISKQIARIPIAVADYTTINNIATVSLGGLSRIVKASGSQNLYAALVTTGTPTYISTSDIIVTFGILQD